MYSVDEELLDRIEVKNGLRQGCTLAPTIFNLYACVVIERWLEKVREVEGVGTKVLYKVDQQLFKRSTRGADHHLMTECQFADDVDCWPPPGKLLKRPSEPIS